MTLGGLILEVGIRAGEHKKKLGARYSDDSLRDLVHRVLSQPFGDETCLVVRILEALAKPEAKYQFELDALDSLSDQVLLELDRLFIHIIADRCDEQVLKEAARRVRIRTLK